MKHKKRKSWKAMVPISAIIALILSSFWWAARKKFMNRKDSMPFYGA